MAVLVSGLETTNGELTCAATVETYHPPKTYNIASHQIPYSATHMEQSITAPSGTTQATFHIWGAGGGGTDNGKTYYYCYPGAGGPGAYVKGTITNVNAGDQLRAEIGEGGASKNTRTSNAWVDGRAICWTHMNMPLGGGGASTRLTHKSTVVAIAGGGGGGGCSLSRGAGIDYKRVHGGYGGVTPGASVDTLTGTPMTDRYGDPGNLAYGGACSKSGGGPGGGGGAGGYRGGRAGYKHGVWVWDGGEGGVSWTHESMVTNVTHDNTSFSAYPGFEGTQSDSWLQIFQNPWTDVVAPQNALLGTFGLPSILAQGGRPNFVSSALRSAAQQNPSLSHQLGHIGGHGAAMITFEHNVAGECLCTPGYYRPASTCTLCTPGYYCEGDDEIQHICSGAGMTSDAGATTDNECYCAMGYTTNGDNCTTCTADQYCPGLKQ